MKILSLIVVVTTLVVLAFSNVALAESHYRPGEFGSQPAPTSGKVETPEDVLRILNRLVNWMFTFLLITATIFVIIAAYNYLFSAGDQEKVKKAHLMIVYAVVALAVGFLARSVEFLVRDVIFK